MKQIISTFILSGLVIILGFTLSCKRKYENEFIGPEKKISYKIVEPLKLSTKSVDFTNSTADSVVNFTASVDQKTTLRINIKGLSSFAERNLTVRNTSDINLNWDGVQDSLYYFRTGEKCLVTLTAVDDIEANEVTSNLSNRGEIVTHGQVLGTDTILISKRRANPKNQIQLMREHPIIGETGANAYTIGYDDETEGIMNRKDKDESIIPVGANTPGVFEHIFNGEELLPFARGNQSITGSRVFMLRGQDVVSKYEPKLKPDYYIGRMEGPTFWYPTGTVNNTKNAFVFGSSGIGVHVANLVKAVKPEDLYFNVFVYGNGDGSLINYTVKENEVGNSYIDAEDESYEKGIVVDFVGWKLFSFKYSEFSFAPTKERADGKGTAYNGRKEPGKIWSVQFSLVAGQLAGKGRMIIDNPIMSWGGRMKY